MELGNKLSAQNVVELNTLVNDIAKRMIALGFKSQTLPEVLSDGDYEPSATESPWHIMIGLNLIVSKMEKIDGLMASEATIGWVNPYSNPQEVKRSNGVLYPRVKKWYDWANYNAEIVCGVRERESYLFTIEDGKYEPLIDKNGQPILTKEGFFPVT